MQGIIDKRRNSVFCVEDTRWRIPTGDSEPGSTTSRTRLKESLKSHFLFADMDEESLELVVNRMYLVHKRPGEIVFAKGEQGDFFYVVESGECEIQRESGVEPEKGRSFGQGCTFGELVLLQDCTRSFTVVARTKCSLWGLDGHAFTGIRVTSNRRRWNDNHRLLEAIPCFSRLSKECVGQLTDSVRVRDFKDGEVITDLRENMYIIAKGAVSVQEANKPVSSRRLQQGSLLGSDTLREGTIGRTEGRTVCAVLRRESVDRIIRTTNTKQRQSAPDGLLPQINPKSPK